MADRLSLEAWCALCETGPYRWRSALDQHVQGRHPGLSVRERTELVDRSIRSGVGGPG